MLLSNSSNQRLTGLPRTARPLIRCSGQEFAPEPRRGLVNCKAIVKRLLDRFLLNRIAIPLTIRSRFASTTLGEKRRARFAVPRPNTEHGRCGLSQPVCWRGAEPARREARVPDSGGLRPIRCRSSGELVSGVRFSRLPARPCGGSSIFDCGYRIAPLS
jgi:hypothetical protein